MIFILASVLTALQIGDWYTTNKALASGHAIEANPIMRLLFKNLGIQVVMLLKLLLVAFISFYLAVLGQGTILIALIVFYVAVLINNYGFIS